jgi:hypothetical protein
MWVLAPEILCCKPTMFAAAAQKQRVLLPMQYTRETNLYVVLLGILWQFAVGK